MNKLTGFLLSFNVFDKTADAFFVKDKNGIFCYCNDAFSALLAISKEKILNATANDLMSQDLAKIFTAFDEQVLSNQSSEGYFESLISSDGVKQQAIFNTTLLLDSSAQAFAYLAHVQIQSVSQHSKSVSTAVSILTSRENEILALIREGNSGKKIANILNLSVHTISTHIKSIYTKLNVHSSTEALYKANILTARHNQTTEGRTV